MSDVSQRKKKTICVYNILRKHTDEDHSLTMNGIQTRLWEDYGIDAERKGIYDDIEVLRSLGADIELVKGRSSGYKLLSREFELSELKLLVDTVSSSKFLTEQKSRKLIQTLGTLCSNHQALELKRHVYITGRAKSENKEIYYNIDLINRAINEKKKIRFKYFNWNEKKERVFRKNGEYYVLSPWEMTVSEEKYYLIAYDSDEGILKHFRVDKMVGCEMTSESSVCRDGTCGADDLGEYTGRMFGMFGSGRDELVVLRMPVSFAGVVIDRFGKDVNMLTDSEGYFNVAVKVCVSRQFYGWLFGLSQDISIVSPQSVKNEYEKMLFATYDTHTGRD